jgi:hypothetical protein
MTAAMPDNGVVVTGFFEGSVIFGAGEDIVTGQGTP